jgi:hypothetical protein
MIIFDFFQNGFEKAFLSHLQKRLLRLVCWDRQAAPIGRKECPRACGGRLVTNAGVVPIVEVVVAELAIPFPCPSIVQQQLAFQLNSTDFRSQCSFVQSLSWEREPSKIQIVAFCFVTHRCHHRWRTAPANNGMFEPFIYKNDHFAKTGSGQT